MRQAPFRANNEITQAFNDGIVTIYAVQDAAEPGRKPVEKLTAKVLLRYEEQRLGIQRFYSGRQNQAEVERVIRVPHTGKISSQDVAITEDGNQYRIDLVQRVIGVFPAAEDLTLVRITQKYEVENGLE